MKEKKKIKWKTFSKRYGRSEGKDKEWIQD